jgi:hypothetical protein
MQNYRMLPGLIGCVLNDRNIVCVGCVSNAPNFSYPPGTIHGHYWGTAELNKQETDKLHALLEMHLYCACTWEKRAIHLLTLCKFGTETKYNLVAETSATGN